MNFLVNSRSGKIHQVKSVGQEAAGDWRVGWLTWLHQANGEGCGNPTRLWKTGVRESNKSIGSCTPSPRYGKAEKFPLLFEEPRPWLGGKHFIPNPASSVQIRPLCLQKGVFLCPFRSYRTLGQEGCAPWNRWYSSPKKWLQFTGYLLLVIFVIVLDGPAEDVQLKFSLVPRAWGELCRLLCNSSTTTAIGS